MFIPVILSGGVGARLWPLSRRLHPKSFIRPDGDRSLLQHAFLRGARLPGVDTVVTVTNREFLLKTRDHYREVSAEHRSGIVTHFILEPFGRNTAPAVALAALWCADTHGEDAVLLILPADHLITQEAAFAEAVGKARERALDGRIVMFGIPPRAAESGYGYIECRGHEVVRFIEKPTAHKAREYIRAGVFLWNSGIFCSTAGVLLAEMETHCPDIMSAARHCLQQARARRATNSTRTEINPESFDAMRADSFDRAVMERTRKAAVVACDIGWSDIGSWGALTERMAADHRGNRIEGDVVAHDSRDCTIKAESRVVATVGLDNLLIVDTPDALLVANKDKDQEVAQVYAALKERGAEAHEYHQTVERQWGTYTVLDVGTGFKVKRLEVLPGRRLSLQSHEHRSEHWTVVTGEATVTNGDDVRTLQPNQSAYIERRHKHRLENRAEGALVVIEVQMGGYLGEDDIVRY